MAPESRPHPAEDASGLIIVVDDARSDAWTVRLSGEVDVTSADLLVAAVGGIEMDGHRIVVLDLTDVTFCDARGLAAVLTADRSVTSVGGHLSIRGASGIVRRIFTLTGVDRELDIE